MADETIATLWSDRSSVYSGLIGEWDDLIGVYMGDLPSQYDDYFHEEMKPHVVNMIRLAWDDLAALAGKVFPIYVDPDNETPKAKERAEKQERIGYGYNEAGKICGSVDMSMLMKIVAWWIVGCAEAVMMVLPDYNKHTPFFTYRDPRTYLPPPGTSPFSQTPPADALFAYPMTVAEIKRRWPTRENEIDRAYSKIISTGAGPLGKATESTVVHIGEFYSEKTWQAVTIETPSITLERSDDGDRGHPGINPVVGMQLYSAAARGRSMFSDQISVQAAMARMFSQKLDYADRNLYPIIFTTPLSDRQVRVGPWAINEWDPNISSTPPKVDVIGPQGSMDFDQTMAFTMGLQRILNRNPEQFQGIAPGGRADSAKALNTLRDSVVNTTVRDMIWPPMIQALPLLYAKAAQLDVNLWPNERKRASGRMKNQAFNLHYRPKVDLEGRERDFQIEPGIGLAGYQGTLEMLQLVGAELMPEDEAIEQIGRAHV